MKKVSFILLISLFVLVACGKQEDSYIAGTYVGQAEGYHSIIKVQVTVDEKNILSIEVLEQEETPIIADAVISKIPPKVIKKNSTDVDVVTGATYTSKTLLKAIDNALKGAVKEQ